MAVIQRTYTHFEGGINTRLGPIVPDMGQDEAMFYAHDSANWYLSEQGIIKYFGFSSALSTPISGAPYITGIFEYKNPTNQLLELIVTAGIKVYKVSGGTATELYSGITSGAYFQAVHWANLDELESLILMNGVDVPLIYDGTTCQPITFIDDISVIWDDARPKFAAVFRGRIFYGGDPNHPYRLYTPKPGTYNDFNDNQNSVDAFDVDPGFGGILTGVLSLTDDFLVIYKEKSIRRLVGSTPFNSGGDQFYIYDVTDRFGCVAPRTLVGNEIEHYFLADDGLRRLRPIESYGDVDPTQPTYLIQDKIKTINYTPGIIDKACSVYSKDDKQVWFAVPDGSSTTNNIVYIYNIITKGIDSRAIADINASAFGFFNRAIYHGDYMGQVYRHGDVNGNNGIIMTSTHETKYIAHGGIGLLKAYRRVGLYADADANGDLIIQWAILQGDDEISSSETEPVNLSQSLWDGALWDQAIWSLGSQSIFWMTDLGRGNAIKFRFINTSATQRPKIRQVDLFYEPFGSVKG